MTTALRPMTTGELLDRTFSIYRNNFVLFAGIAVLAPALQLIVSVGREYFGLNLNPTGLPGPAEIVSYVSLTLLGAAVTFVGVALASAATVHAVSMVHLGKTTTIAESYKSITGYLGRLLLLFLLVGLIITGIVMVFVVPLMLAVFVPNGRLAFGILSGFGFIAMVVLIVIYYARLWMSPACCVVENAGVMQAISRSSHLSKGAMGRIWLILILTILIQWALSFAVSAPVLAIAGTAHMSLVTMTILIACGQFVVATLATPIQTVSMVLVYYDQRVRKEAFDLQLMMDSLGQSGPGQAVAATPIG